MNEVEKKKMMIKGRVVLKKKDARASIIDGVFELLLKKKISFHLVSVTNSDPGDKLKGKIGKPSYLEKQTSSETDDFGENELTYNISFEWETENEEIVEAGGVIVKNEHNYEFYLKSVTLEDVPNHGKIHFICNSWVYPSHRYQTHRIFFTNKAYLPHQTPTLLLRYREEDLATRRGNDVKGMLQEWDRVYDYAYYNDLSDPDKGSHYDRPILGGSIQFPYPRRLRTSRSPSKKDPNIESRLPLMKGLQMYIPRDERFTHLKKSEFLADSVKSLSQGFIASLKSFLYMAPKEFDSFEDILSLYKQEINVPQSHFITKMKENLPSQFLKSLLRNDGVPFFKFPMPGIIKEDKSAWRTDEEFAREMLAGTHPIIIRRLEEFPPVSKLDPEVYGNQNSSVTKEDVEDKLEGLTVDEAMKQNRIFLLDHHDTMMPYIRKINTETPSKVYATRTLLFLKDDGTLKPLAIELSLPHQEGNEYGAVSKVYKPAFDGIEGSIWQLAKAYVAVCDSGYHQLISHWLHTHAVMEPFIIATNRHLSVLHPIYKLLHPHFRDTMNINAIARQIALNADGLFEAAVFPRRFAVEWTSKIYKDWVFTDQALPRDLIKRGMAIKDSESPHGYKLLIEDYPYAVDGLEIWSAIETWVQEYCSFYYNSDDNMVANDIELHSWWKEIREVGHGDLKDKEWWPKMNTFKDLTESCTTIIWIASAFHAALNYGQYPYAGYMPIRPTISRWFIPEPNTPEYEDLKANPDRVLLRTITSQFQTLVGISLIELISRHSSDEVYLGQRVDSFEWTYDSVPLQAFQSFGRRLAEIEASILERKMDTKLKNRTGPTKFAYTVLSPYSDGVGITGMGIPNSIAT